MARFNFSVNVYPFNSTKATKAFASVIIEDVLEIKGFTVLQNAKGTWVNPPQKLGVDKKTKEEKWWPDVIFHEKEDIDPENKIYKGPIQQEIEDAIVQKYQQLAGTTTRGASANANTNSPRPTHQRPADPIEDIPPW